jgi:hypothetical protein
MIGLARWVILAAVSLVLTAATVLSAPILVLLADDAGNLPRWLSWLQTSDATLDGDQYWRDPAAHSTINRLPRYLRRLIWLWRNPGGGFDEHIAGVTVDRTMPRRVRGNPMTSNQPFTPGWCCARIGSAWMLYVVLPTLPGRCLRLYAGWKLMGAIHEPDKPDRAPLVLTFNPIMKRN